MWFTGPLCEISFIMVVGYVPVHSISLTACIKLPGTIYVLISLPNIALKYEPVKHACHTMHCTQCLINITFLPMH